MEDKLTVKESYMAMIFYLENLYEMTNSDDLGSFLGGMNLMEDGTTMDPAAYKDWLDSVDKLKRISKIKESGIPPQE